MPQAYYLKDENAFVLFSQIEESLEPITMMSAINPDGSHYFYVNIPCETILL